MNIRVCDFDLFVYFYAMTMTFLISRVSHTKHFYAIEETKSNYQ